MEEIGLAWPEEGIVDLLFDQEVSKKVKKVSTDTMRVVHSMLGTTPEEFEENIRGWAYMTGTVLKTFKDELLKDDVSFGELNTTTQS